MAAIFKAVCPDGRVVQGPIQGAGGLLGDGCTHLVPERRKHAAVESLRRLISTGARQVVMYPSCSAAGNGQPVAVRVAGTRFYLVHS